tara:strand:- start:231 stop:608 length:378 start_codon:yes stop_codon:yes gene_type:complete
MKIEIEDEFIVYIQAALYLTHIHLEGCEVGSLYDTIIREVDGQTHERVDGGPDFGFIIKLFEENPWFKSIVRMSGSLKFKQKFKYEGSIDDGTYKVTPLSKWNPKTREWEGPSKSIFGTEEEETK